MEDYIGIKFKSQLKKKGVRHNCTKDIVSAGRRLGAEGMVFGNAGNMSARVKNGFIITTAGSELDRLGGDDFALVTGCDLKKRVVMANGKANPSSESIMHHLIYQSNPSAKAVVHAHSGAFMNEGKVANSRLLSTDVFLEYGTLESAYHIVKTMGKEQFIVIKEHGAVSSGDSVKGALDLMISQYRRLKGLPIRLAPAPKPEPEAEPELAEEEELVEAPTSTIVEADIPEWAKEVQEERNIQYEEQAEPAEIEEEEAPPIPLDAVEAVEFDTEPEPQVVSLKKPRFRIRLPSLRRKQACPQCGMKKSFGSQSCGECGYFFGFDKVHNENTTFIKMGRKKT